MNVIQAMNVVSAKYEHGHELFKEGCAICQEEYEKVCEVLCLAAKRYMEGKR